MPYLMCPRCFYGFSTEHANLGADCPRCGARLVVRANPNKNTDIIEQGEAADRVVGSLYLLLGAIAWVLALFLILAKDPGNVPFSFDRYSGYISLARMHRYGSLFLTVGTFLVVGGFGILASREWAHRMMLIAASIAAPFLAPISVPMAMMSIPIITYGLCRMAGIVGVRPVDGQPDLLFEISNPPIIDPQPEVPKIVLPDPHGVAGEFELWVSRVNFSKFNPPVFLDICQHYEAVKPEDRQELFGRVRIAANWPILLKSDMNEEDAKKAAELLQDAGVETIVRDGANPKP